VLTITSPGLKVLFERLGNTEVINRPEVLRLGRTGAVIGCDHIGWVDSPWLAYAVYPGQLRYMSKQELFNSCIAKWTLEPGGSFAVDREVPSKDSIKTVVGLLKNGEILLIFPSGTRSDQSIDFKRGAVMVAAGRALDAASADPSDVRDSHSYSRAAIGERHDDSHHSAAPSCDRRAAIDCGCKALGCVTVRASLRGDAPHNRSLKRTVCEPAPAFEADCV
jgi:1-acyl-sn-glycerol-3-phosphate acyltransferase